MTNNIHTRINEMASEILEEANNNLDEALDLCHEYADGLDVVIYYGKAIDYCANNNTDRGEEYIEEMGGFNATHFGGIACELAFADIYQRLIEAVNELHQAAA